MESFSDMYTQIAKQNKSKHYKTNVIKTHKIVKKQNTKNKTNVCIFKLNLQILNTHITFF